MENISPFFVKNKLKDILTEMSSDHTPFVKNPTSDFTRERKLGFAKMMNLFISKGSGTLKHELLEFMDYHPNLLPTPAAFYQQRSKLDISAFKHVLKEFNNEFPLTTFRDKYYLLACDGTGCKCQYKNVVFLQNMLVGKPTFLFCIFIGCDYSILLASNH